MNSIMMIARSVMADLDLGGRFWFKAPPAGKDDSNEIFKVRIGMTPHQVIYVEKNDISDFLAFDAELGYIWTSST